MINSEKIGGPAPLARIWDLTPEAAGMLIFVLDFGVTCLLMILEGRSPLHRQLYTTFVLGDAIYLPIYTIIAVVVIDHMPSWQVGRMWYTSPTWHRVVLLAAFAFSIGIELLAVRSGQYTMRQELSPSKLWHTIVFVPVFYWAISSLPFVLHNSPPRWKTVTFCLLVLWIVAMKVDARDLHRSDTHLECHYYPSFVCRVRGEL